MEPVSVTAALLPPQPGVIQRSGRCASGSPLLVTARFFSCLLALMLVLATPFALATPTTPTEDFTDNLDGTVTHRITGLTWMRCAMGMTWTGTTCTGTASTYTWDAATKLTANFAGKSDWRLPSIAELNTIVEWGDFNPPINSAIFPNTPNSLFWSGSPSYFNYAHYSESAWAVTRQFRHCLALGSTSNRPPKWRRRCR